MDVGELVGLLNKQNYSNEVKVHLTCECEGDDLQITRKDGVVWIEGVCSNE